MMIWALGHRNKAVIWRPFGSGGVRWGPVGWGRVGSGRVRSGPVGSGRVRSGPVGSGRVWSGRVRSGRVRSGSVGSGRVRSGAVGCGRVRSGSVGSGRSGPVGSGRVGSDPVGSGRVRSGPVGSGRPRSDGVRRSAVIWPSICRPINTVVGGSRGPAHDPHTDYRTAAPINFLPPAAVINKTRRESRTADLLRPAPALLPAAAGRSGQLRPAPASSGQLCLLLPAAPSASDTGNAHGNKTADRVHGTALPGKIDPYLCRCLLRAWRRSADGGRRTARQRPIGATPNAGQSAGRAGATSQPETIMYRNEPRRADTAQVRR